MKTIRENLLTLRAVIEAAPVELFDLGYTAIPVDCGTAFCVFGWAAACQKFPGLEWAPGEDDTGIDPFLQVRFNGRAVSYDRSANALDVLFGVQSHANLFQFAGDGELDRHLGFWEGEEYTNAEEKALALARIDKQLESYP